MKIIFAGGGTGGHLYPAIAIALEVQKLRQDAAIQFVGTERGIEATQVPKYDFTLHLISVAGFKRSFAPRDLFENLKFPFRLWKSLNECQQLLANESPDVVVGTGGFVSGPVLREAQKAGIPTLVQEQNAKPGVTTELLAPRANEVHLSFESSRSHFKRQDNLFVTGNPTRDLVAPNAAAAKAYFEINPVQKTLLVYGGSLGARSINTALEKWIDDVLKEFNVIWQTGKANYDEVAPRIGKKKNLWLGAFIDRMDYAYAAADLVLCRAGAGAIAELTRLGKPSVLVPYPHAAANHQYYNAKSVADTNAALLIEDKELLSEASREKVFKLLKDDLERSKMKQESIKLGKPNATRFIAERVIGLARP